MALTAGLDRVDNVYRALQLLRADIARAIGDRTVLIKPNVVIGTPGNTNGDVALSDTHVDGLFGILEFLSSIGKTEVVIAESSATDPTADGFSHLGYYALSRNFTIRWVDLNQEPFRVVAMWRTATQTQSLRLSRRLLEGDHFLISATKPKSHNGVVATLSLKNVLMAAPVIDLGYYRGQVGSRSDKYTMHGGGGLTAQASNQSLNDNLYRLARRIRPHLAVLDGYEGMEGNGPCWGTAVPHRIALASLDALAADRVGIELMGIDPALPAYLNYCALGGLGEYDLQRIEVLGEPIKPHIRRYRLSDNIAEQLGMRERPNDEVSI